MRKLVYWLIGVVMVGIALGAVFLLGNAREIRWAAAENAVCEATVVDQAGVDITSAFRLRFEDDISANAVRQSLTVEPAIDLGYHQGMQASEVLLVPTEPLQPGCVYRFTLSTDQNEICWAFQTKREWYITEVSPAYASKDVAIDTPLEIYFNQSLELDLAELADYIIITPAIEGSFSQEGNCLRFTPNTAWQAQTVYRVEIMAGIPALASDVRLSGGYDVAFETTGTSSRLLWEAGALQERQVTENPATFTAKFWDVLPEDEQVRVVNTSLYRYEDAADYAADWLEFLASAPPWSEAAAHPAGAPTENLQLVGNYLVYLGQTENGLYQWAWPSLLPEGCYLLKATYGEQTWDIRFQVSNLTAYVKAANGQSLLWAHDLLTGQPVADGSVTYYNDGQRVSTDSEGLALFSVNRTLIAADAAADQYYMQDVYLIQQGERALVYVDQGLVNPPATDNQEDAIWQYICLDQAQYQAGDTLNYWGFMRRKDNQEWDWNRVSVYLYADALPETAILQDFASLNDHVFSGSLELPNLRDGGYSVQIWQSGQLLIQAPFTIGTAEQTGGSASSQTTAAEDIVLELDKESYSLGENYLTTLRPQVSQGSYLFYEAASGIREVTIQDHPSYQSTLTEDELSGVYIGGISFDGSTYRDAALQAVEVKQSDFALRLSATSDRNSYQPGETAKFSFSLQDQAGTAVTNAKLLVYVTNRQGIELDPLGALYAGQTDAGLLDMQTSFAPTSPTGDKQGETLYFDTLELNREGQAELALELPAGDWSLYALAIESAAQPRAAVAELSHLLGEPGPQLLLEALPLYQAGDAPSFLIAWENLPAAWQEAQIHYSIELTGPDGETQRTAFSAVGPTSYQLAALATGTYSITVQARVGAHDYQAGHTWTVWQPEYSSQRFVSRQIKNQQEATPVSGLLLFSSSERMQAWEMLWQVFSVEDIGLETRLARAYALALWQAEEITGWTPPATSPALPSLDSYQKADGGIAAWGREESDLLLSLEVAALINGGLAEFDRYALNDYFQTLCGGPLTLTERAIALAGLAALGEPVLQELQILLSLADSQPFARVCLLFGLALGGDLQGAKSGFADLWEDFAADATSGTIYLEGNQGENLLLNRFAAFTVACYGDFTAASNFLSYLQRQQADDMLTWALTAGLALPHLYAAPSSLEVELDGKRLQLNCSGIEDAWLNLPSQRQLIISGNQQEKSLYLFSTEALSIHRPTAENEAGSELERSHTVQEDEKGNRWLTVTLNYQLAAELPAGSYAIIDYPPACTEMSEIVFLQPQSWRNDGGQLIFALQKKENTELSGQIEYQIPLRFNGVYQTAPALLIDQNLSVIRESDSAEIKLEYE